MNYPLLDPHIDERTEAQRGSVTFLTEITQPASSGIPNSGNPGLLLYIMINCSELCINIDLFVCVADFFKHLKVHPQKSNLYGFPAFSGRKVPENHLGHIKSSFPSEKWEGFSGMTEGSFTATVRARASGSIVQRKNIGDSSLTLE